MIKRKRILTAILLVAFVGFVLWRVTAFPRLRAEQKSYQLSTTEFIPFVLETGLHPIFCSPYGYDGWFERSTGQGWVQIKVDPEANFFMDATIVPPFFRSQVVNVSLDAWPVTEVGTYRFVLPCMEKPVFGPGHGEDILLTSQPFQLQ